MVSLFFGANSAFASEPYMPSVSWDKDAYKLAQTGTITLHSNEANKNPYLIDFAYVHLSSDSDKIGSDYLVVETFVNTGYFQGDVQFGTDTDGETSLKTNIGDLVYVEYDGPSPWPLIDSAKIFSSLDDASPTVQYVLVSADKASYFEGEIITITGEVRELIPNFTLILNVAGFLHEVTVGADKKFSTEVIAGEERRSAGKYLITATYENSTRTSGGSATTTFEFCPTICPSPIAKYFNQGVQLLMISVVVASIGIGVFMIKRRK